MVLSLSLGSLIAICQSLPSGLLPYVRILLSPTEITAPDTFLSEDSMLSAVSSAIPLPAAPRSSFKPGGRLMELPLS